MAALTGAAPAESESPELTPMKQAGLHDLDLTAIDELLTSEGIVHWRGLGDPSANKVLQQQKIMFWDGHFYCPTLAGLVTFGHNPGHFLPGFRIETSIYGVRDTWTDDFEELLFRTTDIPHRPLSSALSVLRGLMCSALLHRSWDSADQDQPVALTVTERRLELAYPGSLVPHMHLGKSATTNPYLIAFAHRLGRARGTGNGLRGLSQLLDFHRARPFTLIQRGRQVRLIVEWPCNTYFVPRWPMESRAGVNWATYVLPSNQVDTERTERQGLSPEPLYGPQAQNLSGRPPSQGATAAASARPHSLDQNRELALRQGTAAHQMQAGVKSTEELPPAPAEPCLDLIDENEEGSRLSLEDRQTLMVNQLRQGGAQSTRELMDSLGWKRGTTRNVLESLLESGMVRSLAESARSPHQLYEAI